MNNKKILRCDAIVVKETIEKACLDDDVDFRSPSKGQRRAPSRALPRPATVKLPRLR